MKTFYSAYTCKGNVGDLLINKYQIEEYAKYSDVYVDCTGMPKEFCDVILDGKNPRVKDFVATYGMSYRGKNMFKTLHLLKKEGFTHFTKSPGPYAILELPLKTLMIRLLGVKGYLTAHQYGMKVFAMGIDLNFESVSRWLRRWNVKYFNNYDAVGVRSEANRAWLEKDVNSVMYCPDMAFLCNDLQEPAADVRKRVAISFRRVDEHEDLLVHLRWICNHFIQKGYSIDIVYQVEEDAEYCEWLNKELSSYSPNYRKNIISFRELNTYEQYDYVFSNRLHVLLMGSMHGAIPYTIISSSKKEAKVKNILDTVFSENLCMFIGNEHSNLESLLASDKLLLRNKIYKCQKQQQDMCRQIISQLFNK